MLFGPVLMSYQFSHKLELNAVFDMCSVYIYMSHAFKFSENLKAWLMCSVYIYMSHAFKFSENFILLQKRFILQTTSLSGFCFLKARAASEFVQKGKENKAEA